MKQLDRGRRRKEKKWSDRFPDAIDRVIGGLEKKNKIISPDEKELWLTMKPDRSFVDGSLNMQIHS